VVSSKHLINETKNASARKISRKAAPREIKEVESVGKKTLALTRERRWNMLWIGGNAT